MPRPKEFSESIALEAAVDRFWQHGYAATSMRDLTASMGLSAPSLYNTFGDKQALFARALEHYLDRTTRNRLLRLESSLRPKEAIQRFFTEIIECSLGDRERKGCFLVNAALEIAPHQREVGALIADQFGEIEAFFKRCIHAAQADGATPPDVDVDDAARLLLGVLLGIRVLARIIASRALLQGVARPALAQLDWPGDKRKKGR
jgi:TetR/AcrR family transcriptional repressor of nem operon